MNGLGAHSNQHPAQSIKHLRLLQCQPRPILQYVLRTPFLQPASFAYRGTDCRSLFLHAGGLDGLTDAGALEHEPEHEHEDAHLQY